MPVKDYEAEIKKCTRVYERFAGGTWCSDK